jgi:hypothetical protein
MLCWGMKLLLPPGGPEGTHNACIRKAHDLVFGQHAAVHMD